MLRSDPPPPQKNKNSWAETVCLWVTTAALAEESSGHPKSMKLHRSFETQTWTNVQNTLHGQLYTKNVCIDRKVENL